MPSICKVCEKGNETEWINRDGYHRYCQPCNKCHKTIPLASLDEDGYHVDPLCNRTQELAQFSAILDEMDEFDREIRDNLEEMIRQELIANSNPLDFLCGISRDCVKVCNVYFSQLNPFTAIFWQCFDRLSRAQQHFNIRDPAIITTISECKILTKIYPDLEEMFPKMMELQWKLTQIPHMARSLPSRLYANVKEGTSGG